MSAELLRRAASGIRAEFAEANDWMTESERDFYLAVADWLAWVKVGKREKLVPIPLERKQAWRLFRNLASALEVTDD